MSMKTRYTVIDGEVMSELRSSNKRDYVPDPLGSTIALLDNSNTKTDTFEYWPYGENATQTGSTATKFQYIGKYGYYKDSDHIDYVRFRYLNKSKSRWISEDPIGFYGNDVDFYRYSDGNPVNNVDIYGLQVEQCLKIGLGALVCCPEAAPVIVAGCVVFCLGVAVYNSCKRSCPPSTPPIVRPTPAPPKNGGKKGKKLPPRIGPDDPIYPFPFSIPPVTEPGKHPKKEEFGGCSEGQRERIQGKIILYCGHPPRCGDLFLGECLTARMEICKCFWHGCNQEHLDKIQCASDLIRFCPETPQSCKDLYRGGKDY